MSKRKDIEYIHKVKSISYKEARRLYKDNGEDLLRALELDEALKSIADTLPDIVESLINAVKSARELIASFDWGSVIDEIKSNSEEVYINE